VNALNRPGNLVFGANLPYRDNLEQAGGRVIVQPSGHVAFYNRAGQRFLYADPDGHALHECEWDVSSQGAAGLRRARIWLDWDQWVGITPQGLVHETLLDLSAQPGWRRVTPDDLRAMAAQAMRVPVDDVRFFYGEGDLTIGLDGRALIRHRKDVFSMLPDGTFDGAVFMACMGAMHWASIDFLPVVELFQSLLPGTGSAAFELIRGLYDDQQDGASPRPLRYRGIPAYPSEGAFRLFTHYFTPQAPGRENPLSVFMDPARASTLTWLPAADPPLRYRDSGQGACVTMKAGVVQKVTCVDDAAGLSYGMPFPSGHAPCDRRIAVEQGRLLLLDGPEMRSIPIRPVWGVLKERQGTPPLPVGWRSLFADSAPQVLPREAFNAVPLYPVDEAEIGEAASQPLVADYLEDLGEDDPVIRRWQARGQRVLITGCEAGLTSLMLLDRPRDYTVVYRWPSIAQRQAQAVWNFLAQTKRLDWIARIRLYPWIDELKVMSGTFDGIYAWVPFEEWEQPELVSDRLRRWRNVLSPTGLALIVGPPTIPDLATSLEWFLQAMTPVVDLPTFHMHRNVLPRARLKPGLTLCQMTPSVR
jgi:hypothetical protein